MLSTFQKDLIKTPLKHSKRASITILSPHLTSRTRRQLTFLRVQSSVHYYLSPSIYSRAMDYNKLATPPACVADFCLVPVCHCHHDYSSETRWWWDKPLDVIHLANLPVLQIGTPTASVSNEVASVQRLMKASGLSYSMHSGQFKC